nr:probable 2-oxoglutarate-dependent dioxygenase AOP1 [Tanacetum cinerariifolium]
MVAPGIYSWSFTRYFGNSPLLPLYESVGIDDTYNPEQVENFTNLMWNSNHIICLLCIAGDAAANDFDTFFADFFKARITEAHFEIIAKEEKEHIVEKKIDVILPLQSEVASPKAKGSLNADEYIGVEEVVGGGEALGIGKDDDLGDVAMDGGDDVVESGDISILNSLIGHGSLRSLQL